MNSHNLKNGERVIYRSPGKYEPLRYGKIAGFFALSDQKSLPEVRTKNGETFICHGIVRRYEANLDNTLKAMSPLEQCQYLLRNKPNPHATNASLMIGDEVFCRSNENDPLLFGTVIGFYDSSNSQCYTMPIVQTEEGQEFVIMGIAMKRDPEIEKEIVGMTPKEQWEYLVDVRNKLRKVLL